jgi:hypothetical protein
VTTPKGLDNVNKKHSSQTWSRCLLALALAASTLSAGGCATAQSRPRHNALTDIYISFRLDPRLTSGLYLGEHWVSPSSYGPIAQPGDTYRVDARALGLNARGEPVWISPEWRAEDSEMVTISPSQGDEVTITIRRAGKSSVQVTAGDVSKTLSIEAVYQNNAIQVVISQ